MSQTELQQGMVIRSVGSSIRVQTPAGAQYDCIVRGKFRIKGLASTNPVAVGDQVKFTVASEQESPVIVEILPRKNYIPRRAIRHSRKVHILAANVDQAILVYTISRPATSTGFTNRFLTVTEAYHIPACIVINKIDLLNTEAEQARLAEIKQIYSDIGYEVIVLSALDEQYRDQVQALFADKISFIGGHSGSGKSTLINLLDPSLDLKTSQVSDYTQKGRHTTTYSEMFPLQTGGYLIDSPGIKELGLVDFERTELSHYFPEMRERLPDCRFNDCTHVNEPGCAVKAALESGEIHSSRYDTYLRMLIELDEAPSF